MKLNWGYRIAILYTGFVGLIGFFVYKSMNEKIELVSSDYYAQELKYQDKIESIGRNNQLDNPVSISLDDSGIRISVPDNLKGKKVTGTILLFRPSDSTRDKTYAFTATAGTAQQIPSKDLERGLYRVKVNYSVDGVLFYTEQQVVINKE